MKKVVVLFLSLVICQFALAQGKKGKKKWLDESAIPAAIVSAYKSKFANAAETKWKQTKKGNFRAMHKDGDNKVEATFSPDGTWKNTRTKLGASNIPSSITSYISSNYADYEVKKVVMHDNDGKEMKYVASLKNGEEKKTLVFDKAGEFLKEKKKKGKGKGKGKKKMLESDEDDGQ